MQPRTSVRVCVYLTVCVFALSRVKCHRVTQMKWLLLALKRTDSTDKTRENGRVLDKEGVEGGGRREGKLTERADIQEAHSEKWQTLRASRLPLAETTYLLPLSCHASQSHSHSHYDLPLALPSAPPLHALLASCCASAFMCAN